MALTRAEHGRLPAAAIRLTRHSTPARLVAVTEFAWDPDTYLELMSAEIADYPALQRELVAATADVPARAVLDLGCGTGQTSQRVLQAHPHASLVGIDASIDMLSAATAELDASRVSLLQQRLQQPLPQGPFDLVVSALAVHHLHGAEKADLFTRVAGVLSDGGRFVLADLVVPEQPEEAYTHIDWVADVPSTAAEQLDWMATAGLNAKVQWSLRDLAVFVADKQ